MFVDTKGGTYESESAFVEHALREVQSQFETLWTVKNGESPSMNRIEDLCAEVNRLYAQSYLSEQEHSRFTGYVVNEMLKRNIVF